ncbi:hypothetical protein AVEN_203478-1 [Araneus ventricosus]|uniref:Uncharacterized protein n=1 Tax=Araneus ventricosus TaxID=182803 RepID=A0A4Y2BJJ0_ARAVE|nr:hypothetical protein AVEN_203478-1 [Araneus ventricosus]
MHPHNLLNVSKGLPGPDDEDYLRNDLETKPKHQDKIRIWSSLEPEQLLPPFTFPYPPRLRKRVMECSTYERRVWPFLFLGKGCKGE